MLIVDIDIMREVSKDLTEYNKLKEELFESVSANMDITEFLSNNHMRGVSRRKLQSIRTVAQLIKELETLLLICPGRKRIEKFRHIVDFVKEKESTSSQLSPIFLERVTKLSQKLEPVQNDSTAVLTVLMTRRMKESLYGTTQFYDTSAGAGVQKSSDWQHFLLSLGSGVFDADDRSIVLKQGELDRLEREHRGEISRVMKEGLERFERRCQERRVRINITQHVLDILENRTTPPAFTQPYTNLAKTIRSML